MKNTYFISLILAALLSTPTIEAAPQKSSKVLADVELLNALGIRVETQDEITGVGVAHVSEYQKLVIASKAHDFGKCGGFEVLSEDENPNQVLASLAQTEVMNLQYLSMPFRAMQVNKNTEIEQAVSLVDETKLRAWVQWFSAFPTRLHKGKDANLHVGQLKAQLEQMVAESEFPVTVELIQHKSTPQNSIRVHIEGRTRPLETVVMGGHMDSINQGFFQTAAPGADDNASGSSNLIEALRILLMQKQPERSVDIFWYAGEEAGLLGSAEIAQTFKAQNKDVIGVLQLDMTLFAGDGEFVLGSMTDFTSAWLRTYFAELNSTYIGARIVEDKCGYGCSDHASWHRQGYPAIMPFESGFARMNQKIHTAQDVISSTSNFKHSAMFSKIAVAFAMDLANSQNRQPF